MQALLKLIPFRDYLYAAIAIAAVTFYNVHVHNLIKADEARLTAAVAAETVRVTADANAKIDQLNKEHAEERAQIESNYELTIQANDAASASELQRLRDIAAKSSGNPVVESPGGTSTSSNSGGSSLVGLGYVSEELATALRDARADLSACYADRESLTGK